ncbi:MAG TPA: TonB-dependent receptor [Candidatus Tumulicola sp.]|nr:TonB-dependent receptor [Candidatus Tumulicola sp.]
MRRFFAGAIGAAALATAVAFAALPASADETGQITITVTDATSKAPISLARVLLDGPVLTSELSGPDGKVSFVDVPVGIYRARVAKSGYDPVTSAQFEVLGAQIIAVDIALAKSQLKSLGTVTVRSTVTISSSSISDSSATRKLSDTLADALNKLSGVSLSTDPNGSSDATVTVSLEGHDPTQTALTLDGVPLNAPGVAGDLRQINTDLFSSASVNFGASAGALGGGVGFRSVEPTLTWQGKLSTSVGSYGKAATIFSEQGTAGGLGIAFTHSVRGSDSPLDQQMFLDTSGLDYTHLGASESGGNLLKLRARLGSAQTLTGTLVSSNNYDDLLCTRFTGPVPCGYGPGNTSFRHFSFASLSDTALAGLVGLQFTLFGTQSTFDRDLLDRLVAGVPSPFGTRTVNQTRGASITANLPSRERHTYSIQATTSDTHVTVTPLAGSPSFFANANGLSDFSTLTFSDKIKSSPKLTLGSRLGLSYSSQTSASFIGGVNAAWNPNDFDTLSGTFDLGGSGAFPSRVQTLTDPASLRFDCNADAGYGSGPGDEPGAQSSVSARMSWQHKMRAGQVTATLYHQLQNDVLLNTLVNGSVLPPGYFPPNYINNAQLIFQSPAGCATPAGFGPNNLYLNVPIAGTRRVYEGIQLTGGFRAGQSLVIEPYYNVQVVKELSNDPRLLDPFSITIPGAQLPGVPLHRAGMTLDFKPPRSSIEWLADAQYVSSNNSQNLPGYVTTDAGVAIQFTHGTLTIAGTNLLNKFGGVFATPANAVPLPTLGGPPLPTVARPLAPRQYSFTYSVKFGNLPAGQNASLLASVGAAPGPNRQGFFASLPALSKTPPAEPFALDKKPTCTGDTVPTATALLDQIKSYVAAVDAAKGPSGYPQAPPADAPAITGMNVTYHRTDDAYALIFTATKFQTIRGIMSCAQVHIGSAADAQAQNLYVPPVSAFSRFPLVYAPAQGFYLVRQPQQPGQEQFRLFRLPTAIPSAPFASITAPGCTAELRQAAEPLLGALNAYFANYDPAKPPAQAPAGWTVTPHVLAKGYYAELQVEDISRLPAVLYCGHVSAATSDEIKALGLDGARPPTLNYTPSIGIYLMRFNPQQRGQN